ncbi:MAG: phosphotransferase [Armatimonadaceae bacterium]
MIPEGFEEGLFAQYPELGRCVRLEVLAGGHINDTFLATYETGLRRHKVVHQRINHHVFRNVPGVMENMVRVTRHARDWFRRNGLEDPDRRVQGLFCTLDGKTFWESPTGNFWRTQDYIDRAYTTPFVTGPDDAYEAAFAFGMFQRVLGTLEGERLVETIPGFHHTPRRYAAFLETLERDPVGRCADCRPEIDAVLSHAGWLSDLQTAWDNGLLAERIVHNDAKVANVLFDSDTGEGLAVIDLDTVMPGLAAHDFGDLVRSTGCAAAEDETDLAKVFLDRGLFDALASGFLVGTGDLLTDAEVASLVPGAKTIVLEQAIRFLTDHIDGDRYFRIHRPNHNLDRARTQLALLGSILECEDELNAIVRKEHANR